MHVRNRTRIPHLESPPDVSLLLLAHSEQHLLNRKVIPVLHQLETGERLPEEQLPAATAYLEVIWAEAAARARQTDAALRQLEQLDLAEEEEPGSQAPGRLRHPLGHQPLTAKARRYHAAVRAFRETVAQRVLPLITAPVELCADRQGRLLDRQASLPDLIP